MHELFIEQLKNHYQSVKRAAAITAQYKEGKNNDLLAQAIARKDQYWLMEIGDQPWYARQGYLFGLAALLEKMDKQNAILAEILKCLKES